VAGPRRGETGGEVDRERDVVFRNSSVLVLDNFVEASKSSRIDDKALIRSFLTVSSSRINSHTVYYYPL